MDPALRISAVRSTLSSRYLSRVTCHISTSSYWSCVRDLCRHVFSVERVSFWCDLLHKYVFIWIMCQVYPVMCASVWCNLLKKQVTMWTLCQVYLPSSLLCWACICLEWHVTKARVHMDTLSGVSALMSILSNMYVSGVTLYKITCSFGHCVLCICRQVYPVESVSNWCSYESCVRFLCRQVCFVERVSLSCHLLHNYVFIRILCQIYLPSGLPCRACDSLVWPLRKHVSMWILCKVYLPSSLPCRACICLVWPVT
jgi:hypothetical protein